MKIIAHISVISDDPANSYVVANPSKEYDSKLVPMKGMDFEDPAWKKPKEIVHVTINALEEYYYIYVGEEHYVDQAACDRVAEMYRSHGWKC